MPIVATLEEAIERGADSLLIGVAPPGGKLDPAWRPTLLAAVKAGLSLEAGLHTQLNEDPELRARADAAGVELRDLRAAPARPDRAARARTAGPTRCGWCTASARTR